MISTVIRMGCIVIITFVFALSAQAESRDKRVWGTTKRVEDNSAKNRLKKAERPVRPGPGPTDPTKRNLQKERKQVRPSPRPADKGNSRLNRASQGDRRGNQLQGVTKSTVKDPTRNRLERASRPVRPEPRPANTGSAMELKSRNPQTGKTLGNKARNPATGRSQGVQISNTPGKPGKDIRKDMMRGDSASKFMGAKGINTADPRETGIEGLERSTPGGLGGELLGRDNKGKSDARNIGGLSDGVQQPGASGNPKSDLTIPGGKGTSRSDFKVGSESITDVFSEDLLSSGGDRGGFTGSGGSNSANTGGGTGGKGGSSSSVGGSDGSGAAGLAGSRLSGDTRLMSGESSEQQDPVDSGSPSGAQDPVDSGSPSGGKDKEKLGIVESEKGGGSGGSDKTARGGVTTGSDGKSPMSVPIENTSGARKETFKTTLGKTFQKAVDFFGGNAGNDNNDGGENAVAGIRGTTKPENAGSVVGEAGTLDEAKQSAGQVVDTLVNPGSEGASKSSYDAREQFNARNPRAEGGLNPYTQSTGDDAGTPILGGKGGSAFGAAKKKKATVTDPIGAASGGALEGLKNIDSGNPGGTTDGGAGTTTGQ